MDFTKLIQDQFAQSVLLAIITAVAPMIFTYLMEHFGWRASLSRDAKLYEELRATAGDNASDDEMDVIRVARAKVFDRARSHMIDQSKGLRAMARIIETGLFAMYALVVFTLISLFLGQKGIYEALATSVSVLLAALIVLTAAIIPWSIYDKSKRSKARRMLYNSRDSELLFTNDSKTNIKKQ